MHVSVEGSTPQDRHPAVHPAAGRMSGEAYFETASKLLGERPSTLEPALSAQILERTYGMSAKVSNLSSELECTDGILAADGRQLILKTSTRHEAVDSFRFQAAALERLHGTSGFAVPEIVPASSGDLVFQQDGVCGYLQTRIEGQPLHAISMSSDLLRRAGASLGALDKALGGLDLPAADRPILWHIGCWPRLMNLHHYLPHGEVADCVYQAMEAYQVSIAPQLDGLAWQVTHNDPSPFNMLSADGGIAFIDFGDGCWNPRIQDLAIAASHMVADPALPLGGAEYLISGYASQYPLSPLEARLLVGLMRARQSALILVNYWRAHLFPSDAAYIKKNVGRAERGLSLLRRLSVSDETAAVARAVSM